MGERKILGNINERIKIKLENRNNKIISFVLIIIVLILSSYRTYTIFKTREKDESLRVEEIYKSIDKKFNFLNMTIYDFKISKEFNNYFFEKNKLQNKQYKKLKLFDELKKTNTIYGIIGCSINIIDEEENLVFTSTGTIDKNEYLKNFSQFLKNQNIKRVILKDQEKINIIFKDDNLFDRENIFWLVSLNENDFFSEIKLELDNWYITNKDKLINLGDSNKRLSLSDIEKKKRAKIFIIPYFYEKIIYIPPRINIESIFFNEILKITFIFGILSLLGYLIKYFVVKPIKKLAINLGYMNDTNEKELEYIEHKIQEINLKNKDLEYKISDMRIYQKRKKIKDYLIGLTEKLGIVALEDAKILKIKKYRVIIMEIFDIDSVDNIFNKFNLSKELMMKYFSEDVLCEEIDIDYKSIAFILEDTFTTEELQEIFNCIVTHIERNYSLRFTAAITKGYEDMGDLPQAYRAAKKLLDYKFVFKEKKVIFEELLDDENMNKYYYPIELEAKLILRTLSSNELSVRRTLDEIFDSKNSKEIDKKYLKEFTGLLYNTLGRIFIQLKEMNKDIDIKIFNAEEILQLSQLEKIREKFEEKILEICKYTKVKESSDAESIKIKIEKFLEENYMVDISLDNLADYLGHSFKYTSVLFKKVMGDNFKNYLNVYRLEKAKEFMEYNKDLKIKELAELVGYNSSNTFIRIFRKYEGVSPGKYFGIGEHEE
ncbi:response regulator transcription factor [uncultured Fusobacterium sp.]|uniref:AraC family transcriptional regulator n=1 Tax=uncultured Fusobacterium sp. TaxID=159267 RepID=UPI0025F3C975|nr:response regulator transcription factor [uncultured Fusobacterium sp.]